MRYCRNGQRRKMRHCLRHLSFRRTLLAYATLSCATNIVKIFRPAVSRIVKPNLIRRRCRRTTNGCGNRQQIFYVDLAVAVDSLKLNTKCVGPALGDVMRLIADNGQKRKTPRKGGVSNVVNCSVSAENSRKRSPSERTERRLY